MRLRFVSCAMLIAFLGPWVVGAKDDASEKTPTFAMERFYRDLRSLVRAHYPDATSHRLGSKIHFEHDTRIYIVHEALKTGQWQDPWEERGPRMGGVHCDLSYHEGPYGGAAVAPQTFDKRYFTVLLLAPYSARLNGHLRVLLKLPANGRPPEGFREQVIAMINGFEKYLD